MAALATALRNTLATAFGAEFNSGSIEITTSADAVLATFTLQNPAFGSPSTGVVSLAGVTLSVAASGTLEGAPPEASGTATVEAAPAPPPRFKPRPRQPIIIPALEPARTLSGGLTGGKPVAEGRASVEPEPVALQGSLTGGRPEAGGRASVDVAAGGSLTGPAPPAAGAARVAVQAPGSLAGGAPIAMGAVGVMPLAPDRRAILAERGRTYRERQEAVRAMLDRRRRTFYALRALFDERLQEARRHTL